MGARAPGSNQPIRAGPYLDLDVAPTLLGRSFRKGDSGHSLFSFQGTKLRPPQLTPLRRFVFVAADVKSPITAAEDFASCWHTV